jgi:hypothetical protein
VGSVRERYGVPDFHYKGDGTQGRNVLEYLNDGVDLGYRDKAKLLKECFASEIAKNSPSFHNFISKIDFDWGWAAR